MVVDPDLMCGMGRYCCECDDFTPRLEVLLFNEITASTFFFLEQGI